MPDPLILVPGMLCDARAFWHQIIALSGDRAVMVAPPARGATVEEMAEDILAQAPARFALAGQGLGGNVTLEMLRRAPERVLRIALIATNAQAEGSAVAVAREPRIVGAQAGRLAEVAAEELPGSALADGSARDEILDMVRDMALTLGEGAFIRQSRAMQRRPDQQKVLRRAMLPALVICGADDPVTPAAAAPVHGRADAAWQLHPDRFVRPSALARTARSGDRSAGGLAGRAADAALRGGRSRPPRAQAAPGSACSACGRQPQRPRARAPTSGVGVKRGRCRRRCAGASARRRCRR